MLSEDVSGDSPDNDRASLLPGRSSCLTDVDMSTSTLRGISSPMPRTRSKVIAKPTLRKIDFDGACLVRFDGGIDWKDRHSNYAASFVELLDGSLIYIAERIQNKWYYGLWNPLWEWQCTSLRACRKAIREDFNLRMEEDATAKKNFAHNLYFPNMQWSRNYAYRRLEIDEDDYENDVHDSYDHTIRITYDLGNYDYSHPLERTRRMLKGVDYTVWLVYAQVDGFEKIRYVIERIGKKWLGARWDGTQWYAGTTLRECQGAIWAHMTKWYRTIELKRRVERYQSHMDW